MENILKNILSAGIRDGKLKDNRLANVLLNLVDTGTFFSSSRRDLAAILVADNLKEAVNVNRQNGNEFSDLRFLGVAVSGIKKYPASNPHGFGLSFSREGDPISSVIVGSNGVGKTSMYAALEYAGMRKVNTAAVRGYKRKTGQSPDRNKKPEEDQSQFLLHCGAHINDVFLNLITKDQEIKLEGSDILEQAGKAVVSEVFYCSDYDVHELECNDDYTRFMLRQIGLNHLYHALQLLYYLKAYVNTQQRKEATDSEIWRESPENIESIQRLILGIASGSVKDTLTLDQNNLDLTRLINAIQKEENLQFIINSAEEILSSIKRERGTLPPKNWFSKGFHNKYSSIQEALSEIKKYTLPLEKERKENLLKIIDEFKTFRISLISNIQNLRTKLEETQDQEARLNLIEEIAKSHTEAYNKLFANKKEFKNDNVFLNKEYGERFDEEYNNLVGYLECYLENALTEWKSKIASPVEKMLSEYFDIDNDKVSISLSFDHSKHHLESMHIVSDIWEFPDLHQFVRFNINILTAGGDLNADKKVEVRPRQYLNTFRFKLFCVALKIVLGCFVKEKQRLNYPFVIDDVFDSSDFDNRLRLKLFIEKIVKCHDDLLDPKKYPIQIIFFSQDDLIADQIHKGLLASRGIRHVKFGRLYDYREAKDGDIKKLTVGNPSVKENSYQVPSSTQEKDSHNIEYISIEDIIGD